MIETFTDFDLSRATTFALPAVCSRWIEYDSPAQLPAVLAAVQQGTPWKHIGGGSNMLFAGDFNGTVLHSRIKGIDVVSDRGESITVRVGSGHEMDSFIAWACTQGLWGVENLSGIPGEAGAAAVQNVGAYGVEAADVLECVHVFDPATGSFDTIDAADCGYAYRESRFKHPRPGGLPPYIITVIDVRLWRTPHPVLSYPALASVFGGEIPANPQQVRNAVIALRDAKLPSPALVPNAGSFFKNPVVDTDSLNRVASIEGGLDKVPHYSAGDDLWKIPAAWLIERCGWKGRSIGPVTVWHLQPLVLTNPHRAATGADVIEAERQITQSVLSRYGIALQPEVEHIGVTLHKSR